jgi:hypothetical protein
MAHPSVPIVREADSVVQPEPTGATVGGTSPETLAAQTTQKMPVCVRLTPVGTTNWTEVRAAG